MIKFDFGFLVGECGGIRFSYLSMEGQKGDLSGVVFPVAVRIWGSPAFYATAELQGVLPT